MRQIKPAELAFSVHYNVVILMLTYLLTYWTLSPIRNLHL